MERELNPTFLKVMEDNNDKILMISQIIGAMAVAQATAIFDETLSDEQFEQLLEVTENSITQKMVEVLKMFEAAVKPVHVDNDLYEILMAEIEDQTDETV